MSMETDEPPKLEPPSDSYGEPSNFILGEIQVLLSEKRTSLPSLRTGIAGHSTPTSARHSKPTPAPLIYHKPLMIERS